MYEVKTGEVVETFHRYICPQWCQTLPPYTTKLTGEFLSFDGVGITDEMVRKGVTLEEAVREWDARVAAA